MASSFYVKDQNQQGILDSRAEMSRGSKNHSGVYSYSLEFTKNGIMTPITRANFKAILKLLTSYFHILKHT